MRKTQNKRTLSDILQYIRLANRDGVLRESMMSIASHTGYSNATVHRALQALDEQGMIKLIAPRSQREPMTIQYIGPEPDDYTLLFQRAIHAMRELRKATTEVECVMDEIREAFASKEHHVH